MAIWGKRLFRELLKYRDYTDLIKNFDGLFDFGLLSQFHESTSKFLMIIKCLLIENFHESFHENYKIDLLCRRCRIKDRERASEFKC